jgi:hypothetical protein
MFLRTALVTLMTTASFGVQAAPEWVALKGANSDATFVNPSSISAQGQFVDVEVLRDFAETITLGNDSKSGAPLYSHRSVTLTYKVDCATNRLAVTEWQMFDGNLGQGQVVWDQTNINGLAFVTAVNAEMRAVLRSACTTTTVWR